MKKLRAVSQTLHSLSLLFFFFFFIFFSSIPLISSSNTDLQALMAFKTASDTNQKLVSWNETTNICSWFGVFCQQKQITRLVLENLDLSGDFQPLTVLTRLRVLSLKHNRFTGPIPDLSNLTSLKLIFLSQNNFSGEFPAAISTLPRLLRLDISNNNLTGQIPVTLNSLTHLLTLRLENNQFSGMISGLKLANLEDFNVSGNHLTGAIPGTLSGFPASSFAGNLVMCGSPLPSCKNIISDPTKPVGNGNGNGNGASSPLDQNPAIVSSSPSSKPEVSAAPAPAKRSAGKISTVAIIAIVLGDFAVLAILSGFLFCYFWRNFAGKMRDGKVLEGEKIVYSASPYTSQGCFERGSMVFFEGVKRFELEDLLRASAEMLGKGSFGTAYKAVLEDGSVVAVKRLKEVQVTGKREFEQHMEMLGRLRHTNVVSLRAYYYARDEKLLVYEYMPNESLFSLLHGNRGPGRTPLDWTTRMKIAAGAARGLAFLHHTCRIPKLAHGNIKSTNVLLDKAGNACISDFGLAIFSSPATAGRTIGYRAPEQIADPRKISQKTDVYSFGVLLLELLTGKPPLLPESGGVDLPRWVQSVVREEWTAEVFDLELMRYKNIEEEMVGMLQIGMACASPVPDHRPKIGHVVKMIEEIRGEHSPSHDSFDSVSYSPSLSEDAGAASSQ